MLNTRAKIIISVLSGLIVFCMGNALFPFIISLIVAYALHLPMIFISKNCRLSSSLSAIVILLVLISIFCFFVIFLLPLIKHSIIVIIENLPKLFQVLSDFANDFMLKISKIFGIKYTINLRHSMVDYMQVVINDIPSYLLNFLNTGKSLISIVVSILMIPIITFYLLKDWIKIEIVTMSFISKFFSNKAVDIIRKINDNLSSYVKGQLIICVILILPYILILNFFGVKEYLVSGIIAGMMAFIPFFGPFLSLCITLSLSFDDLVVFQYIGICSFYLIISFLDSNFLTPKLIGQKTGINSFWLLFTIFATVSIFGLSGFIIAVPIAVIISTLFKEIFKNL